MARVNTADGSKVHGKLNKKDNQVHRVINGREFVHAVENPYDGPASKNQKAHRTIFGQTNAVINTILADPAQKAEWRKRMEDYNRSVNAMLPDHPKRFATVRQYAYFVISEQLKQTPAAKQRKSRLPLTLPKELKLHVKRFPELSAAEIYEILKARFTVFVGEQHIHYLDEDNIDYIATHFALRRKGTVIAYARLFPDKPKGVFSVGRLLTIERGKGYAKYLMQQIIHEARTQGAHALRLHAQTYTVPFYKKLGFRAVGEPFIEAEIPHILMEMPLA